MMITRREAMVAVAGCGLVTTAVGVGDDKPAAAVPSRDPVYSHVPSAVRQMFEEMYPQHRCIRLVIRARGEASAVYRATVFNPTDVWGSSVRLVNGESVVTPMLDELEVDARGKVLEETPHSINPARVPQAVVAAYQIWNPTGVKGQHVSWTTEVPRGQERVYHVGITMSSIKLYRATYRGDGTVVKAEPAEVR